MPPTSAPTVNKAAVDSDIDLGEFAPTLVVQ